jgi:hypothetical protein
MALPSATASQLIVAGWQSLVTENPVDNIFDEYSELARLEKGKSFLRRSGGTSLIGNVEYAVNTTVESISPYATLDVEPVDIFDQWEASWKQYAGSKRKTLNEHIFGATAAATDVSGYQSLIPDSPSSGSKQGIANSYTFWRSKQTSGAMGSSAHDNLRSSMRTMRGLVSKGQGVKFPTRWVTGEGTARAFEGLLVANERINDKKDSSANGSFTGRSFLFGDAPVEWDFDCADARMYALNNDDIKMAYQAGFWFKGYPAVNPANQLLNIFKTETICQLVVLAPRHLGVVTSIS